MRRTWLILAAVTVASCNDTSEAEPRTDPTLDSLLISAELAPFRLKEERKGRFATKYVFTTGPDDDRSLHMEVFDGMDAETAGRLQEDGIMGVEALYADALSPYPGDISRTIVKDRRFSPKLVRKEGLAYYLLYANERFGYGASSGDAVQYLSLMGWLHCQDSGRFFKIRLFAPAQTSEFGALEKLFVSMKCANPPVSH